MAHIRQPKPDYGLALQVEVLKNFYVVLHITLDTGPNTALEP